MVVVIGFGGGTNSGKTTICSKLVEKIPKCFVFNQDKYFKTLEEAQLSFPDCEVNWETCPALKMDDLVADVKREMTKNHEVIIVEGHLVLNFPPLVELFDATIFITLSRDLAHKRRLTRTYDPPDGPGYFENVVWPGYLLILEEVRNNEKIKPTFLDAAHPDHCYSAVEKIVTDCLSWTC
jgi:nicotinamide/nicotinate riboside kinase